MVYNLQACLNDVAKKRGRMLGNAGGSAAADYQEVWDCLNRYITSCLDAKKGISIKNFCKIGYQLESTNGKTKHKPYFHLAEAFCKNYAVETKKGTPIAERELAAFEEFIYSKAAIKFSKNLTKDNVFCGLRYIVQAFGEAMTNGQRVEVDFECGRLTVEQRKWRFSFDASKTYEPSADYQVPSTQAMKKKLQTTRAAAQQQQKPVSLPPHVPIHDDEPCFSENNFGGEGLLPTYQPAPVACYYPEGGEDDAESASDLSDASVDDPAKYKGPTEKQEKAHREAMDRYLTEMEIRASEAIADRRQWEDHLDRCLSQERSDMDRKKALAGENSDFIMQQIEWNRVKRNHDRKNFVASASAHEFPKFTEPDDAKLRAVMKDRQQQMRDDLDLQVRTNNALKTIERNKERELEYAQLVANKNELIVQECKERKAKDFEKSLLTDSWGREVRMRNIWKAIDNHTSTGSGLGAAGGPLQPVDDDCVSVASSRGFGTRNRKPNMGAAMSLEQQKAKMGRK